MQWTDSDLGQVAGFEEPPQTDVFAPDCGGLVQGIKTQKKVHCEYPQGLK